LGYGIVEVNFGGKPNNPGLFVNRRTEMWWTMREWLEQGGSIPNDPFLKAELATPTYSYDSNGRRVLESKDEIKRRLQGGASPDIADALALTFAFPVGKQLPREVRDRIDTRPGDYDPYEGMQ
jgi:phage terminase large subunit